MQFVRRTPKEVEMRLSAPKQLTWWIAVIIGAIGFVLHLVSLPMLAVVPFGLGFWLVVVGFVILLIGTAIPGF